MSEIQFSRATKKKSRLRLGIMGAAGSGKTLGSLKLAKGIASSMDKVFVIDTEHGSADLYSDKKHGLEGYNTFTMGAPFTPLRYVEAIQAAEKAGAEVIIIDSVSHAWVGEGGALDQVDKKQGNSYTAWKDVTPQHRALVEGLLQSNAHIICTLRSKQEYVLEEQQNRFGKTVQVPVRKGMAPVQREGMEYEFTVFVDVREDHHAMATKDRTGLVDGKLMMLTEEVGKAFKSWLDSGEAPAPQAQPPVFTAAQVAQAPVVTTPAAQAYHPDTNDGPDVSMMDKVKELAQFHERLGKVRTRAEGAKLWDDLNKANIDGAAKKELLEELKKKASTLSAE